MMEFAIRLAVSTLVTILASTIKNPKSERARNIRKYVVQVNEATGQFLELVPAPTEE